MRHVQTVGHGELAAHCTVVTPLGFRLLLCRDCHTRNGVLRETIGSTRRGKCDLNRPARPVHTVGITAPKVRTS